MSNSYLDKAKELIAKCEADADRYIAESKCSTEKDRNAYLVGIYRAQFLLLCKEIDELEEAVAQNKGGGFRFLNSPA